MKKIGLIMEANPFHNGHAYFLEKIKKKYPNSQLIAVISTTITQRGEISVLAKKIKTKLLLENNVDLVIELPIISSCQGGYYFAYDSVEILNKLKIDLLVFGSESNDKNLLMKMVKQQESLTTTTNFSKGYQKEKLINLKSNDILGISYIRAIQKINPRIKWDLIERINNNYNEKKYTGKISSATAIRQMYNQSDQSKNLLQTAPLQSIENITYFNPNQLMILLKYNLNQYQKTKYNIFLSEKNQLINKIFNIYKNVANIPNEYEEFVFNMQDKNNSKYKIQRLIIMIILNITEEKIKEIKNQNSLKYHVLGFNKTMAKELKNNNLFFYSYKNKTINYQYNEMIDQLLKIINKGLNEDNYSKPIIF